MITPEMIQLKVEQLQKDEDSLCGEEVINRYIEIFELKINFYTEQADEAHTVEMSLNESIRRATSGNLPHLITCVIDDLLTGMIIDKAKLVALQTSCYQKIAEYRQHILQFKARLD